jgi:hypothetical protein
VAKDGSDNALVLVGPFTSKLVTVALVANFSMVKARALQTIFQFSKMRQDYEKTVIAA